MARKAESGLPGIPGTAQEPSQASPDVAGLPVAILGCGAVGSALAVDLAGAGAVPVLWSRTAQRAEELAGRISGARCVSEPEEALSEAALTLLCVSDQALAGLANRLATKLETPDPEHACLHTNGARGLGVLESIATRGFGTGKVHPLIALPPPDPQGADSGPTLGRFRGAWIATLGQGSGKAWARRIARVLGAQELALVDDGDDSSLRLHAAAALLSGGFVALYDLALEAAEKASVAGEASSADAALMTLLASSVSNLARQGTRAALTGPVARGAEDVVAAHLATLSGDAREAYRVLGRRMLALALVRGSVDDETATRLSSQFQ